jgi:hypothetical protein
MSYWDDLNILINNARNGNESDVSGLWFTILPEAHISLSTGYSIHSESIMPNNTRSDIAVKIIRDGRVVLVIECKSIRHDNPIQWDMALTQLSGYLQQSNCRYGIIAVGHKCKIYSKDNNYMNLLIDFNWIYNSQEILQRLTYFSQYRSF